MAELNRRPGSPGDDPTPPPDGNRGGQPDRRAHPDTGRNGDQGGDRTRERSQVRGASPPVPQKAPSRWGISHRPAPDNRSGVRPNERPGPDPGAGRGRTRWSRTRPAPRDDRAASDTPPGTVRNDARSAEITGLQARAADDRSALARLQADDRDDRPKTADANGPGAPDEPGPPAPPDHPDDPERERPDEPTALDAANAEIAELRKQLADSRAELDTAKTEIGELKAQIETVEAEADAKVDAARAEFDAKLEASQKASDARMTALEARFAAVIDGLQAKDERREHAEADAQKPEIPAGSVEGRPLEWADGRLPESGEREKDKSLPKRVRRDLAESFADTVVTATTTAPPAVYAYISATSSDMTGVYIGAGATALGIIWAATKNVMKWKRRNE